MEELTKSVRRRLFGLVVCRGPVHHGKETVVDGAWASIVRKQREMDAGGRLTPAFIRSKTPVYGIVLPTFRVGLHSSGKPLWNCPCRKVRSMSLRWLWIPSSWQWRLTLSLSKSWVCLKLFLKLVSMATITVLCTALHFKIEPPTLCWSEYDKVDARIEVCFFL